MSDHLAAVTIDLTDEQRQMVRGHLDAATLAHEAGRTGAVFAQVFGDFMRVAFVAHEPAKAIQDVLIKSKSKRAKATTP